MVRANNRQYLGTYRQLKRRYLNANVSTTIYPSDLPTYLHGIDQILIAINVGGRKTKKLFKRLLILTAFECQTTLECCQTGLEA